MHNGSYAVLLNIQEPDIFVWGTPIKKLTAGKTHTGAFWWKKGSHANHVLSINGVDKATAPADAPYAWTQTSFTFTAAGTQAVLSIVSTSPGWATASYIDSFTIAPADGLCGQVID